MGELLLLSTMSKNIKTKAWVSLRIAGANGWVRGLIVDNLQPLGGKPVNLLAVACFDKVAEHSFQLSAIRSISLRSWICGATCCGCAFYKGASIDRC